MTNDNSQNPGLSLSFRALLRFSLPTGWAGVILWLSLTSSPPDLPGPFGWDKLLHAGAYGLLCLLSVEYFHYHRWPLRTAAITGTMLTIAFGGLLEVLQGMMHGGRTAEWWDLVADAVGAVTASVIFCRVAVLFSKDHEDNRDKHG